MDAIKAQLTERGVDCSKMDEAQLRAVAKALHLAVPREVEIVEKVVDVPVERVVYRFVAGPHESDDGAEDRTFGDFVRR